MGIQILTDTDLGYQALYCTTTDTAFGPIFTDDEDAQEFLEWLPFDARRYSDNELGIKVTEWRSLPQCIYCDKKAELSGRTPFKRFCSDECEVSYDQAQFDMGEVAA